MADSVAVTVVISTYNGAEVLPRALDSVLNQDVGDLRYEVIVVDNNSVDDTRRVVESYGRGSASRLRYVFEGRQGVSYGRNAGIQAATAPIIAFSDDDVSVSRDWVRLIAAIMAKYPEVDFIGGKVLPRWVDPPPAWLTDAHWSPLALVDYGPAPFQVNSERQLCLVTANLAVRRALFDTVGLFSPDLQRVKDSIGSMEDHELLIRFWRAGKKGLYVPELVATTVVPPNRMTKMYHRRWHRGHGVFCARMRYVEDTDPDGRYVGERVLAEPVKLFGLPGFLYRQIGDQMRNWMVASVQRRQDLSFMYENNVRFLVSYVRTRYREERAGHPRLFVAELGSFATNLVRKKVRSAVLARFRQSMIGKV